MRQGARSTRIRHLLTLGISAGGLGVLAAAAALLWTSAPAPGSARNLLLADLGASDLTPPGSHEDPGLWFEPNEGQASGRVAFQAKGLGYAVHLTRGAGAVLSLSGEEILQFDLIDANIEPSVVGEELLPGVSNYLVGNDRDAWHTGVPHYGRVRYEETYPGVDLEFYGSRGQLEYDFIVAPGADPSQIRVSFRGADEATVDGDGDLVLSSPAGDVVHRAPVVYQVVGSERYSVDGSFRLLAQQPGEAVIGFHIGGYDPAIPLVIDPKIDYSTYLGGNVDDLAYSMAVDSSGSVYITGLTHSANFPTKSAIDGVRHTNPDLFVTKFDPSGSGLVFSTYLGGGGTDQGTGIAVDSSGNVYVAGETSSTNFPTHIAYQPTLAGGTNFDGFITKLNAAGSALIFSTYWGGTGDDRLAGLSLDILGNPYVTGTTRSSDFPTKNALQGSRGGVSDRDAFVSKLNDVGTFVWYSTYLGGSGEDSAYDIAVNSLHQAYVVGGTDSTDFPTRTAYQPTRAGGFDAFVAKLTSTGGRSFVTYFGGSSNDGANAVAVGPSSMPYFVGSTESTDFPTSSASQPTRAGMRDAFVVKLVSAGTFVTYSTYHGGSDDDVAESVAVDQYLRPHVVGYTRSTDFPVRDAIQPTPMASEDGFAFLLDPSGAGALHSTYLGGSSIDLIYDVAVGSDQSTFVLGHTYSTDFPTRHAFQPSLIGARDVVLVKIDNSYLDFFLASVPIGNSKVEGH